MDTKEKRSWLGRLIIAALVALISGGTIGLISVRVQFGPITLIFGDHNKVENGGQTQTAIQPAKPQPAEAKPQQIASEPVLLETPVQQTPGTPATRQQTSYARRARPVQYQSDEDCTCPDDEQTAETEPQPAVSQSQTQAISSGVYSQSQTQSSSSGVYVQSNGVTVRTSTTGGNSHTRVVINGKVVVDQ